MKFPVAATAFVCSVTVLHANGFRVDINYLSPGRTDMYTSRWVNWAPASAATITTSWGDTGVTFRNAGSPGSEIKCGWYKGLLTNGATLTVDGLTIDGATSGGSIEMELSGLPAGRHSLVTWHSFFDNVSGSPMDISVDGTVTISGLNVPTRVKNDRDAARAYIEFDVQAGESTVITFSSGTNVVLNGFEIDGTDPPKKISDFTPSEGDNHYRMEDGLNWAAADGATSHDVYFGEDSASVDNATATSTEFKGNQTATEYELTGLSTLKTYWWRVDEQFGDEVVKGDVIPFRKARLAFPTAMGYGRFARGGRGGRVVEVTNLDNDGPGSLRHALETEKGPRTVVFRVGGVIPLDSKLIIPKDGGDVYIAGQTAPGDGICVTRFAMGPLGAEDVIIRHIRLRVGDYAQDAMDGMGMASCDHCIIDHCSISWSVDEAYSSRSAKNITYQRNLVSEALNNSVHFNGTHSFAASISGKYGSFLYNLHAHCAGRNWSLAGGLEQDAKTYGGYVEIINNVVYNWRHRTTDGGVRRLNFVNNFYKGGPASEHWQLVSIDGDEIGTGDMQKGYVSGNKMINASGSVICNPGEDNWRVCGSEYSSVNEVRSNSPLFPLSIDPVSADEAYKSVTDDVGATRPAIDAIDKRILKEVKDGSYTYTGSKDRYRGILDSQNDAGGYPTMSGGTPPADSDHDGMPDDWETEHGLDPDNADDRNNTNHSTDEYTNLEMYLNELAGDPVDWNTTTVRSLKADVHERCFSITARGLRFDLPAGSRVRVDRFDASGKMVRVLHNGVLPNGQLFLPSETNDRHSSGISMLKVSVNGRETVVPVLTVR